MAISVEAVFDCASAFSNDSSYSGQLLKSNPFQLVLSVWSETQSLLRRPKIEVSENIYTAADDLDPKDTVTVDVTADCSLKIEPQNYLNQFTEILIELLNVKVFPFKEYIAKNLYELFQIALDEEPETMGVSIGSLREFIKFIKDAKLKMYPVISLTNDRNIYASWKIESGHLFSVHFLPSGVTHFVIFEPERLHPGKKMRFSGIISTDRLLEKTKPLLKEWLFY